MSWLKSPSITVFGRTYILTTSDDLSLLGSFYWDSCRAEPFNFDPFNSLIISGLHRKSYNKSLGQGGIEKSLLAPTLKDIKNKTDAYDKLFSTALDIINLDNHDNSLVNLLRKNSEDVQNDVYSASLKQILAWRKIPKSKAVDALSVAVKVLFYEQCNNAIKKLTERSNHMKDTNYFDF